MLWRLGGKRSSFALGPGVRFAWQHDAELLPEGNVSIFDDEASPPEGNQSRAIVIALNQATHGATLARQLTHPGTRILTQSQGNAQALPGDEEFVGWGEVGYVSQFSAAGALTFDMRLPRYDEQLSRLPDALERDSGACTVGCRLRRRRCDHRGLRELERRHWRHRLAGVRGTLTEGADRRRRVPACGLRDRDGRARHAALSRGAGARSRGPGSGELARRLALSARSVRLWG